MDKAPEHDHSARGLQFFTDEPKALRNHLREDHAVQESDWFCLGQDVKADRDMHALIHYEALTERRAFAPLYEEEE